MDTLLSWISQAPDLPVLPYDRDKSHFSVEMKPEKHPPLVMWSHSGQNWHRLLRSKGTYTPDRDSFIVWASRDGEGGDVGWRAQYQMSTVAHLDEYNALRQQSASFQLIWFQAGLGSSATFAKTLFNGRLI